MKATHFALMGSGLHQLRKRPMKSRLGAILLVGVVMFAASAQATTPTVPAGYTIQPYVTGLTCPRGISFSPGGNFGYAGQLFVADADGPYASSGKIYRVPSQGQKSLFATTVGAPMEIEFAPADSAFAPYLYGFFYTQNLQRFDSQGAWSLFGVAHRDSLDIELGPGGVWGTNLYHLDSGGVGGGDSIRVWTPTGTMTTFTNNLGENALGMAFAPGGGYGTDLYVGYGAWGTSISPAIRKLSPAGTLTNFATSPDIGAATQLIFDTTGNFGSTLLVSDYLTGKIFSVDSNGHFTTFASGFSFQNPMWESGDMAFGPDGALYIAEGAGGTVWRIVPEPATLSLLALGFALSLSKGGLAVLRRGSGRVLRRRRG